MWFLVLGLMRLLCKTGHCMREVIEGIEAMAFIQNWQLACNLKQAKDKQCPETFPLHSIISCVCYPAKRRTQLA